jgi:hypothetical protein
MNTENPPSQILGTYVDVRVHGMLAEQVYAKLLAGLCEPEEAVERDDIGEDPAALVVMHHVEETEGHLVPRT